MVPHGLEMLRSVNVTSRKLARGAKMEAAAGEAEIAALKVLRYRNRSRGMWISAGILHAFYAHGFEWSGRVGLCRAELHRTWQFQIAGWAPT